MGGEGSMLQAIKSLENNRKLRRRRLTFRDRRSKIHQQKHHYTGLQLTPAEKARMNKLARRSRRKELWVMLVIHLVVGLGLYWWLFQ